MTAPVLAVDGLKAYYRTSAFGVRREVRAVDDVSLRVAPGEIRRRARTMREIGERKREAFARRFLGRTLKVLLEEQTQDGALGGYSRNYVRVLTRGHAGLTNQEVAVEASFVQGAQLVGEIFPASAQSASRTAIE